MGELDLFRGQACVSETTKGKQHKTDIYQSQCVVLTD